MTNWPVLLSGASFIGAVLVSLLNYSAVRKRTGADVEAITATATETLQRAAAGFAESVAKDNVALRAEIAKLKADHEQRLDKANRDILAGLTQTAALSREVVKLRDHVEDWEQWYARGAQGDPPKTPPRLIPRAEPETPS